jgi:hypothetical protein
MIFSGARVRDRYMTAMSPRANWPVMDAVASGI